MRKLENNNQKKGMIDISEKSMTRREAIACASVTLHKDAFKILMAGGSPKGDVFETAKVAGILAAKETPRLIPMCHPLELSKVGIEFYPNHKKYRVEIRAEVSCCGKTGVEMEALTAAAIAALTIYDIMKYKDKGMVISDVKLLSKTGGKSGDFQREV